MSAYEYSSPFDVHKSVYLDTFTKVTNKMQLPYILKSNPHPFLQF